MLPLINKVVNHLGFANILFKLCKKGLKNQLFAYFQEQTLKIFFEQLTDSANQYAIAHIFPFESNQPKRPVI